MSMGSPPKFSSTNLTDAAIDIILAVYADNAEHGRHHERERSTFANVVVAGAAAILVFVASEHLRADIWWVGTALSAVVR